jgi:hypothetical protein
MGRTQFWSILAAGLIAAATLPAGAQTFVETGREFREGDRVTMGTTDLLTAQERQAFDQRRKAAGKNRQELDRIEAEESALLNQRVNERVARALAPGGTRSPSTTERPVR